MNLGQFWRDFVVADRRSAPGPNVNISNDKQALTCDIIEEQKCGVWTPKGVA